MKLAQRWLDRCRAFYSPSRHHWTPHSILAIERGCGLECHATERSAHGWIFVERLASPPCFSTRWCHARVRWDWRQPTLAQQQQGVFHPIPNPFPVSQRAANQNGGTSRLVGKPTTTPDCWGHGPIRGRGISDLRVLFGVEMFRA